NPIKPNGTTCNDGDGCTDPDTCQAGACRGPMVTAMCSSSNASKIFPQFVGLASYGTKVKAVFTYLNTAPTNLFVPYGSQNALTDADGGFIQLPLESPPQWFSPGNAGAGFAATLAGPSLTWTVGGNAAVAHSTDQQLSVSTSAQGVPYVELPNGTLAL